VSCGGRVWPLCCWQCWPLLSYLLLCRSLLCSVWYELAYIESRQGVSRGGRVWQLAFGSGFKFNSNVMVANRKGES
jgi:hypothetical protein